MSRHIALAVLLAACIIAYPIGAQPLRQKVPVERSGETSLALRAPTDVRVILKTSREPGHDGQEQSALRAVEITVAGKNILVPRSVFCDLTDVTAAELKADSKTFVLLLTGGDASEAYIVRVEFGPDRIRRRTLASLMAPQNVLQDTTYRIHILRDK